MLELWMILALGTALSWAILDVMDKYIVDKFVKNPLVILVVSGVVNLFFGIGTLFLQFQILTIYEIFVCFLIALTNLIFVASYLKAFQIEEVSRVVPVFQTSAIFVAMLAFIFLGERLGFLQYLGILLLVLGAILVTLRKSLTLNKAFLLSLSAAIFSAINFVLFDYIESTVSYSLVFGYSRVFFFLLTIPFLFFLKTDLDYSIKRGGKTFIISSALAEVLNTLGTFLVVWAFSIGSVSLVNALVATEPLMVLGITVIITLFFPRIIKEDADKGTLIYKLFAILLIMFGIWMLG